MQDVCTYFLICFRPLTKQCQWKCGIFTYRTLDRHKVSISAKEYSKGNLCVYVANSCSSYSAFKIWCGSLQCGDFESQDTSRSGRYSMMSTFESIDHVHDLSFADQRISNCWTSQLLYGWINPRPKSQKFFMDITDFQKW